MALLATSSLRPAVAAGPRYWTLFGWFREFRRDPLAFLEQCARRYGGVAKFTAPPITGFVLSDPEWTRHVLERRANRYGKGRAFRRLTRYVGHGILFTDGERWRTGRRLARRGAHLPRRGARDHRRDAQLDLVPALRAPGGGGPPARRAGAGSRRTAGDFR